MGKFAGTPVVITQPSKYNTPRVVVIDPTTGQPLTAESLAGGGAGSPALAARFEKVLNVVTDFGAKGDGVTDDSAAFAAAAAAARDAIHEVAGAYGTTIHDRNGGVLIEVPVGDFLITNPGAFLGDENPTVKCVGIAWKGAGAGLSNILFKPTTAGTFMENDMWLQIQMDGLVFHCLTAGSTFFDSHTAHNAQGYRFNNVSWYGPWKYGIHLQGNDNNSELHFYACRNEGTQADGAFLYSPAAPEGSDQFLNYWFYGFTHWSTSAPMIDMSTGGHVHIYGLDASNWGSDLTSTGYLFRLGGATHASGVCVFEADGVRVEAKNNNAALLYSEWGKGTVLFSALDWSSQQDTYTYGDIIRIVYQSISGAIYKFRDSQLAGGVRISWWPNDWEAQHSVIFEDCTWAQRRSPSDVVSYDASGSSGNDKNKPPVKFIRCHNPAYENVPFSANGAAVWDAVIGYRGDLMQVTQERVLSLRGVQGVAEAAVTPKAILPVGAIITGFEVLATAGAYSSDQTPTWTLRTQEGTPTTIATITATNPAWQGFRYTNTLSVPFLCDTQDKAMIAVGTTNLDQPAVNAMVLVKGYW